jgi:hypothetical protein
MFMQAEGVESCYVSASAGQFSNLSDNDHNKDYSYTSSYPYAVLLVLIYVSNGIDESLKCVTSVDTEISM